MKDSEKNDSESLHEAELVEKRREEDPRSGKAFAVETFISPCTTIVPLVSTEVSTTTSVYPPSATASNKSSWWQAVVNDFDRTQGGDFKIVRAIGRTATVNAAVAVTALTAGTATGLVGFATGGAITAKRFGEGLEQEDAKEVVKSLVVYGSATSASVVGQLVAGGLMVGVAGASLPVAAAVAFGVGCGSGITAGATSEWAVDKAFEKGGRFWSTFSNHLLRHLRNLRLPTSKRKRCVVQVSKTNLALYNDSF